MLVNMVILQRMLIFTMLNIKNMFRNRAGVLEVQFIFHMYLLFHVNGIIYLFQEGTSTSTDMTRYAFAKKIDCKCPADNNSKQSRALKQWDNHLKERDTMMTRVAGICLPVCVCLS